MHARSFSEVMGGVGVDRCDDTQLATAVTMIPKTQRTAVLSNAIPIAKEPSDACDMQNETGSASKEPQSTGEAAPGVGRDLQVRQTLALTRELTACAPLAAGPRKETGHRPVQVGGRYNAKRNPARCISTCTPESADAATASVNHARL